MLHCKIYNSVLLAVLRGGRVGNALFQGNVRQKSGNLIRWNVRVYMCIQLYSAKGINDVPVVLDKKTKVCLCGNPLKVMFYFRDPNLWVVKCRMGEENATAIHLMRKFITYQFTDEVKYC